jgi:thioredoxin-like negative regulator of GroEL
LPTRQQLEELLRSEPDDLFLRYALAKACVSEGNLESGLEEFRAVLKKDPDYVPAYFQMAQALADAGQTEPARETLTSGIAVARRVKDAHAEAEMTGYLEML